MSGSSASGWRNTVTENESLSDGSREPRPLRVVHLIASCMAEHGPSSGIVAQLKQHAPSAISSEVWSMYSPPTERDPTRMLACAQARHVSLGGSRRFLDPWT